MGSAGCVCVCLCVHCVYKWVGGRVLSEMVLCVSHRFGAHTRVRACMCTFICLNNSL